MIHLLRLMLAFPASQKDEDTRSASKQPGARLEAVAVRRRCAIGLALLAGGCLLATETHAQDDQVRRGFVFAQTHCASCHAVGRTGESPLRTAPALRTLHLRYPVENLAEAFAEGIVTAHPAMPQFQLELPQIGDLIAYLKSLEG